MNELELGLRAQDFHESLNGLRTFGPMEVHFEKTLLVGKAASLAMHLRGLQYIDDIQGLKFAAATLGIPATELEPVLAELQAIDFLSVTRSLDSKLKRIELRVPEFRSGYSDLGRRLTDLMPGEIESAGVSLLHKLHSGAIGEQAVRSTLDLEDMAYRAMCDVMSGGFMLSRQIVSGQPMLYTPLAVDGNPAAYVEWSKKFPNEVAGVVKLLEQYQGIPLQSEQITSNHAVGDAVATGVLMPVRVQGGTGEQRFLFAPKGGLDVSERAILDKARAIVSCVRYGQSYASGVKIKYPDSIIRKLIDNKRFTRGHPDLFQQYGLLVEKMIGHPYQESNGHWNFQVDDTDENMKALSVALEMTQFGSTTTTSIDLEVQKSLLAPNGYMGPLSTRPQLAGEFSVSDETRSGVVKAIGNLVRGLGGNG